MKHVAYAVPKVKCKDVLSTDSRGTSKTKVTIHMPEKIPESVRRQKINRLYEILSPKTSI